jgi:hypothetical protein
VGRWSGHARAAADGGAAGSRISDREGYVPILLTLAQLPEVCEYQVLQTQRGAEIAVLARSDLALDGVRTSLTAALRGLGLVEPCVRVTAHG